MTNLTSKLAIGGSVVAVLLLLFSAMPVSCDCETVCNASGPNLSLANGEDQSGDLWDWTNNVLTLEDGALIGSILIKSDDPGKTVEVDVKGKVTVEIAPTLQIFSAGDIYVHGGGKIIGEYSSTIGLSSMGSASTATIDNVSIDLTSNTIPFAFTMPTKIINCPSIKLTRIANEGPLIYSGTDDCKLKIENTNLYLVNEVSGGLVVCQSPISMDGTPVGDDLIFVNDGIESEVYDSETTTEIYTGDEGGSMKMESYVPPAVDPTPYAIGIFVVLLAVVAVGTFVVYRK